MQEEAADAGFVLDKNPPGVEEAWLHYVDKQVQPLSVKVPPRQPSMPKPPMQPRKLRDVFDKWKAPRDKESDNVKKKAAVLTLYEKQAGNPPLFPSGNTR